MATDTAIVRTEPQTIEVKNPDGLNTAGAMSWTYRPNVDVYDTPDAFVFVMDLPGAQASNIDVSIESNVLTAAANTPATTSPFRPIPR